MEEKLQVRVYGEPPLPTLVYLPGLHGDWTLIGSFRQAVAGKVRFVEMTYPRTLRWSLDDYAAAIEEGLAEQGVGRCWLIGESFGSQPLWSLVARNQLPHFIKCGKAGLQIEGLILAGGFVKHPMRGLVRLAEKLTGRMSNAVFIGIMFGYAKMARFRYRHSPETLATLDEFIARRTEADRRAAQHRLHLIADYDPRPIACQTKLPVFGLSGILDPIVPWFFVGRWMRKNCPALRDYRIIFSADHNVLSTAPRKAAEQVLKWIGA